MPFDYDDWKTTPPPDPKEFSSCLQCGESLFEGEEVFEVGFSDYYCSEECVFKALDVKKVGLGEEY